MNPLTLARSTCVIHPTAVVDPTAQLGEGVEVGPYAIIGKETHIGAHTRIAAHGVIGDYTRIGAYSRIYSYAVVGSPSQDLKHRDGDISWLEIGEHCLIREFVTVNRATAAGAVTRVGHHVLLMAYVHVAHDCQIGDRVVLANAATLGGHARIEDDAVVGAMTGIHQFVQVGRLAMVGAMAKICQDVPPFMLVDGRPARVHGLNTVGLRRQGVSGESRRILKQAYHLLYRRQLSLPQAIEQLESLASSPEIQYLLSFLSHSQRGMVGIAGQEENGAE